MFQSQFFEKREHTKPGHGVVSELLEVLNQKSETVLTCEHLLIVRKKP
jgi:acyl dehydratase